MPPDREGGIGGPVTCLTSTFTFHASLFENDLLPRFLGLRYDQTERENVFVLEREGRLSEVTVAVFVDAVQVDGGQSTGRWLQVPVALSQGCQHSKVTLLVWEKFIRIIVASANLTVPGYRKNREMASAFDFFDGEESAPRELLNEALDFFHDELLHYGKMPPATSQKLREAVDQARATLKGWRRVPTADEKLPSVSFVPVLPKRNGRTARNALKRVVEIWGSRRASYVTVMTPFNGDSPEAVKKTLEALGAIPRTKSALGSLIVGGHVDEGDKNRLVADLPSWFRDEWINHWQETAVYVVPQVRDDEAIPSRKLHAKALLVQSDDRTLLLCGSSNFTPRGLGLGTYNIEANLCFLVRDKKHAENLEDSLPVDWVADEARDAKWDDDTKPTADESAADAIAVPAIFCWATYHDRTGVLTIGLNRDGSSGTPNAFPERWSIRLAVDEPALFSETSSALDGDRISLTLEALRQARRVTSILVDWVDSEGHTHQGRLPTLVADDDELLAPEEFRALTSDGILDCLLSGRNPFEWVGLRSGKTKSDARYIFDPLKEIDTRDFVLYRTRRLGRALAALSQRLCSTLRTTTALRYRLQQDPIGPLMFAKALVHDAGSANEALKTATIFALIELTLSLAHVGNKIDPKGKLGIAALFRNAIAQIQQLREEFAQTTGATSASLTDYGLKVGEECARVLGVASEVAHAG